MTRVLITGAAGFIGFMVATRLLKEGHEVHGLDNMSAYYDVGLKQARVAKLDRDYGFRPRFADITEASSLRSIFADLEPEIVVHLAAQPGVRHSITNPHDYVTANLIGHANVLEACRAVPPRHLLYASSSSIYGANGSQPFRETDPTDRPMSFYAATKRANEAMTYSYSHLYGIAATGLRFFTVYGDWGRPDMAPYLFAKAISEGSPIDIFNRGDVARDFTFGADAAEAVSRLIHAIPNVEESGLAPHRVVNIASGRKVALSDFITALERNFGRRAVKNPVAAQSGDVQETWADISLLQRLTGFTPVTSLEEGVGRFVEWFKGYHGDSR